MRSVSLLFAIPVAAGLALTILVSGIAPAGAHPSAPSPRSPGLPTSSAASLKTMAGTACPTPTGIPDWNSPNFFQDILVTFSDPGQPSLSGSNFQTVPCLNQVPRYTTGFWMNVSTNVVITDALVTIWASTWPTPTISAPPLPNFDPANPALLPMYVSPSIPQTASFYFNVNKYFWPGSTVYFNITVQSSQASPSTIVSTDSAYTEPFPYSTGVDYSSWKFAVGGPWWSTNFSNDISITTSPSILTNPAFEPNPRQNLFITLASRSAAGGVGEPIPMALLTFHLSGVYRGLFSTAFGPVNHTTMTLVTPLGPYPNTSVTFNVTAWLPWQNGAIDTIVSPTYAFNWSTRGGWWYSHLGLEQNAQLSSAPDVFGTGTVLPTGTDVNVSVHEPIENVTISSAVVNYQFADAGWTFTGSVPMASASANTTYRILPGLPPSSSLQFSLVAKDVFYNPLSSGNATYSESGQPTQTLTQRQGLFFVETVDLSTGHLVANFPYTISNATWSIEARATPFGFGGIPREGAPGYLPIGFGTYIVTGWAFGHSVSTTVNVTNAAPFTVRLFFASGALSTSASSALPLLPIATGLGLAATAVASYPLVQWYIERRKKAEAEQRRITL